jgi:hypothetical protein
MKILKNIWNTFFPNKKLENNLLKQDVNSAPEQLSEIVSEGLESKNVVLGKNSLDAQYVGHIERENSTVTFKSKSETKKDSFKKHKKNVIGLKTKEDIKKYLLQYGSINTFTCEKEFKVKSLKNFIWHLRKEGFVFKTEKIILDNKIGEKTAVINYVLMPEINS